jgi:hypothetical protein
MENAKWACLCKGQIRRPSTASTASLWDKSSPAVQGGWRCFFISYAKWKEIITFLSDLSRKTKLTNAEVKQMEAKAEAMRKAGLIVTVGDQGLEVIRN